MTDDQRLRAFEDALAALRQDAVDTEADLERLRSQGKTKTATYRQLVAHRTAANMALRFFKDL